MSNFEKQNSDQKSPTAQQKLGFCPNCGKRRMSVGKFCNYCGFKFEGQGCGESQNGQISGQGSAVAGKESFFAAKNNRVICAVAAVCIVAVIAVIFLVIPKKNPRFKNAEVGQTISFGSYEQDNNTTNGKEKDPGFKNAEVGETISFGSYEQDNNTSNGKEEIEWIVLAKEGNRMLVTSKYGLDAKPYNEEWEDVPWEKCTLRKWLNGTFLNEAFNGDERSQISMSKVTADKNPWFDTDPGKDTEDKVFLLSISEAEKYFSTDDERVLKPTEYALEQGAFEYDGNGVWWLRSPGHDSDFAAYVNYDGHVYEYGFLVCNVDRLVRPALWINL